MSRYLCIIKILMVLLIATHAQAITLPSLKSYQQLIIVTSKDWSSITGQLQVFNKTSQPPYWHKTLGPIAVVLGKKGMAWAKNQAPQHAKWIKQEGDEKSPAGVFSLGKVFGFAKQSLNPHYPYLAVNQQTLCIDDPNHPAYDQIIQQPLAATSSYQSAEFMGKIKLYQHGIVIKQNPQHQPSQGSCVFIHIWRNSQTGTAGCTALAKSKLQHLIKQLKSPALFIQLPKQYLKELATVSSLLNPAKHHQTQ